MLFLMSLLLCMLFTGISMSTEDVDIIRGVYSYVSNPCITKPCLPGMVFAVLAKGTYYYLTIQGRMIFENRSWEGYSPEPGAIITVEGYLRTQEDIMGKKFFEIEVISLKPAK